MNGPFVEVTRGNIVESSHAGHAVVCDVDGRQVFAWGDPDFVTFPRSAVKAIQALPLVESGAADAFGFGDDELALACASHSGEPDHVATARRMLGAAGLDGSCLECGGHWSLRQPVLIDQARIYGETPGPICNNCSGKHAGFVCTAVHLGEPIADYVSPDHPVQRRVRAVLEDLTGARHDEANRAVDGCSIPTYAIPLSAMAIGFARMVAGLEGQRAKAASRLIEACMSSPHFVAGRDRFCTDIMRAGGGTVFAKTGAEGVYCGALPKLGLGIALKCVDGSARAAEIAFGAIAAGLTTNDAIAGFDRRTLTNWRGIEVGEIHPAPDFHQRLLAATVGSR